MAQYFLSLSRRRKLSVLRRSYLTRKFMSDDTDRFGQMNKTERVMTFSVRPTSPSVGRKFQMLIDDAFEMGEFMPAKFKRELFQKVSENTPETANTDSPWYFLLSLLIDLESWGARFDPQESGIDVIMPIYDRESTSEGVQTQIRDSMSRLRASVPSFDQSCDLQTGADVVQDAVFRLREVDDADPESVQIFKSGITTWSMPYRSREGRSKRFVVQASNEDGLSIPVGLLEIGDDAPHNPVRDSAMGFMTSLDDISDEDRLRLANRFESIRRCLKIDSSEFRPDLPIETLFASRSRIRAAGVGRTVANELAEKKRLTYLARLVSAEAACRRMEGTSDSDFAEGLRVLRDLSIPRTTTELTICGALPPFGSLLIGKLVAMMGIHPQVRKFVDRDFGSITSSIFDTLLLQSLIPNHGVIFVTTKGLYPGHSSQYNGVTFPGSDGRGLKLKKLGDTTGQTSSHLSRLTMRLASQTAEVTGNTIISRLYGSGGAKRQRTIAVAVRALGLPIEMTHAYVSRPVYGFSLVDNLKSVLLYNDSPKWRVGPYERNSDVNSFEEMISDEWRSKWIRKALGRNGIAI